jgi:hypothetical protein
MNVVTSFFLRAKHWQIFLLVFGVYFAGELVLMCITVVKMGSADDFAKFELPFGFVMAFFMSAFFMWFWSMGSFLSSIVQPALKLKTAFFRFALIYPGLYGILFIATFQKFQPRLLAVIVPLHLFAMFCMFYDLYFVSKNLVLAETSKPASFYDYAGPFFLLWFFPIGVWIVQPRINRLFAENQYH